MDKTKTKIDGQSFDETCTLEQLIAWSQGRWQAGQHEAALNVQKRVEALARVIHKDKKFEIERDEGTGELKLVFEAPPAAPVPAGGTGNV